jgi:hypothetical protein
VTDTSRTTWPADDLTRLGGAEQVDISTRRRDGSLRPFVPIWIVSVDGALYVRSYRGTGGAWYRHASTDPDGAIKTSGLQRDVTFAPADPAARDEVDAAYCPFKTLLADHRAQLGKVMAISTVQNVGTYIGTVFIATYLSTMLGFSKAQASTIVLLAVLSASVLIPIAGIIGSRIGARKVLLASYIGYAVLTIPSFLLMGQHSVGIAIAGLILGMLPTHCARPVPTRRSPSFSPSRSATAVSRSATASARCSAAAPAPTPPPG